MGDFRLPMALLETTRQTTTFSKHKRPDTNLHHLRWTTRKRNCVYGRQESSNTTYSNILTPSNWISWAFIIPHLRPNCARCQTPTCSTWRINSDNLRSTIQFIQIRQNCIDWRQEYSNTNKPGFNTCYFKEAGIFGHLPIDLACSEHRYQTTTSIKKTPNKTNTPPLPLPLY